MRNFKLRKFSSQAPIQIPTNEGYNFQDVSNEAFSNSLNKNETSLSSLEATSYFNQSLREFRELYEELAK